jgi:hypothetical protein
MDWAAACEKIMPVMPAKHSRTKHIPTFTWSPAFTATLMAWFSFAVCYFRSFVSLNNPLVLWGDQVGFFNDGSRMVAGQLPYRDYFLVATPGTDLVYALLIQCFGVRMWIPNLLMACLAGITALLMTLIASRLMRAAIVALPALLFAGFMLLTSMEATHHWFSTIAILAAILAVIDGTTLPRVVAAGAWCGIAACFTQNKGALAVVAFAACLAWGEGRSGTQDRERWQKCLLLCGVAAVVFAAVNAYYVWAAGLRHWLFCIVEFPLRYYGSVPINNWRVLIHDVRWHGGLARWAAIPFIYATVPLVYFVFFAVARRRSDEPGEQISRRLLLVAMVGIAMFLAIASSPSVKRLATVSPPAMILLAWLLDQPGSVIRGFRVVLVSAALTLAIAMPLHIQTRWRSYLDLPSGRSALLDPELFEEYDWLLHNTQPGQYLFGLPPLHYAFHMRNPAAIEGYETTNYTRPEQVAALVEALERRQVPLLVIRQSRDLLRATDSPSDHLGPFRTYVISNYRLTKSFPTGDDVWQRVETPVQSSEGR